MEAVPLDTREGKLEDYARAASEESLAARHQVQSESSVSVLRLMLCLSCLLGGALGTAQAQMACLSIPDPTLAPIQALVIQDANKALAAAQSGIAELQSTPPADATRLASLYALEAESYSMLELDGEARIAASKGLALAPQRNAPLHVSLLRTYAENIYDETGLRDAEATISAARAAQQPESIPDTCLLITLGYCCRCAGTTRSLQSSISRRRIDSVIRVAWSIRRSSPPPHYPMSWHSWEILTRR